LSRQYKTFGGSRSFIWSGDIYIFSLVRILVFRHPEGRQVEHSYYVWVGDLVLRLSVVWTTIIMRQAWVIYWTLAHRHSSLIMSLSWLSEKPCVLYEDSEWPVQYTVLTKHGASFVNDYTAHPYSTAQSYADDMNHQYTVWKLKVQPDRPQMTTYVS
jgi:hypothetical protein